MKIDENKWKIMKINVKGRKYMSLINQGQKEKIKCNYAVWNHIIIDAQ